ncbi:MAG: FMN-binding protein, partial [Bacillota bacterium]
GIIVVAVVLLAGALTLGAEAPSYRDGSYIGYVPGDQDDVAIEVVIQFGIIVDVNMINPDKPGDDKPEAAKALFLEYPLMVVKNQKAEIDGVSGATQYVKATQMALDIASGKYTGNVYYGLAKNPKHGHVLLAVTVEDKKVTKVEFICKKTKSDLLMEAKPPDYKNKAAKKFFDEFPDIAVRVQTDLKKIDAISGATNSFRQYTHAYETALKQAGLL